MSSFVLFRRLSYGASAAFAQVPATYDESAINAGVITDGAGVVDGLGGGFYSPTSRSARVLDTGLRGLSMRPLDGAGANLGSQWPYLTTPAALATTVGAMEVDTADNQFAFPGIAFQPILQLPARNEAVNDHIGKAFGFGHNTNTNTTIRTRFSASSSIIQPETTVTGWSGVNLQAPWLIAAPVGSPVITTNSLNYAGIPGTVPLTVRIEWLLGPAGARHARCVIRNRDTPATVYLDFTFDVTAFHTAITTAGGPNCNQQPCRPMIYAPGGSSYDGIKEIRLYRWVGPENNRVYLRPSLTSGEVVGWFRDTPGFGVSNNSQVVMTGDGRWPHQQVIARGQRLEQIVMAFKGEGITTITGQINPDERGVATLRPLEPVIWPRNDAIEILVYPNLSGVWPIRYDLFRGTLINNPGTSMAGHTQIGTTFTPLSLAQWPHEGANGGPAKIVTHTPPDNNPYLYILRCTDASGAVAVGHAYGRLLNRPAFAGLPASNRLHVFHLGDSNSTGGDSVPPVAYGPTSFEWRQRGELFGTYLEQLRILTGIHCVGHNYAVSGQATANIVPGQSTITSMEARIAAQVPPGEKFVVSISIGGNDATNGVSAATFKANIKSLIDYLYLTYPNVIVVLHSMHFGTAGSQRFALTANEATGYRQALTQLASETPAKIGGLNMLDMQAFGGPDVALNYPATVDGIVDNKHVDYHFLEACGRHCAERTFEALRPASGGGAKGSIFASGIIRGL